MSRGTTSNTRVASEVKSLRARLQEAEETLEAIRSGAVDAIVVKGPAGSQVFTLQGAEHPYRVLAETMNEGAASLARDGTILFCNRRLAEILDVPQMQIPGSSMSSYIEEDQRHIFGRLLSQAQSSPQRAEFECCTKHAPVTLLLSLSPIGVDGGEGICLVATDVTEQKKLEKALEKFAGQLGRSNDELSQFAYMISHELQEPLRHIFGFGELLREQAPGMSAQAAEYLERMQNAARRASDRIDQLLQSTRAGAPARDKEQRRPAGRPLAPSQH